MPERVQWAPGKRAAFLDRIDPELRTALGDRESLHKKWTSWLEQYRAFAVQPTRNFPFEGAANYVLPVTATDVDQLYANFLTTIHEPQDLWTCSPQNDRWVDAAKTAQDYLTLLDRHVVKMYDVNQRALLEMTKLGTAIFKHGWEFESRWVRDYDENGKIRRVKRIKSQPFVDHVRCFDFVIPTYAYNIQPDHQGGAPWVAERVRISVDRFQMLKNAKEPVLPNVTDAEYAAVAGQTVTGSTDWDAKVQQQDYVKRGTADANFDTSSGVDASTRGASTTLQKDIELWEIHARCQTKGDDYDDIICLYHLPTRTLMREIYQPYDHGHRPYERIRYFPGEGFWGIGVCEQKEMFQKGESELFNYQMDNVLLANSRMMVAKSGANIVPGEPIYPGKIFFTDGDVGKDFGSFQMGDIYQSLPQIHEMFRAYGKERSGVNEISLGNISALPGRTPATSVMALQAEGKKRPDLTLKDMRHAGLSTIGLRLFQLSQQYLRNESVKGPEFMAVAINALGIQAGTQLMQQLIVPNENAELGLGVELTATSAVANKEVQKQTYMGLLQLSAQIAPANVQLAQMASQAMQAGMPAVAVIAAKAVELNLELQRRILEQNDIRNTDQLGPQVSAEDIAAPGTPPPAGPQPGPGGVPGSAPANPAMAPVPNGAGAPV